MWQAFKSLTTTKQAQGRMWKRKRRLKDGSSFWLRRLGRSKVEQSASTFVVEW
jgi:hypothetical protein